MSDEMTPAAPATPAANPVVASAQQALAVKELGETVAAMNKKMKTLWIAIAVVALIAVAAAVFAIGPRFGLNLGGMGGARGQFPTGANGTFQRNGQTGVPGQDQTTPAQ